MPGSSAVVAAGGGDDSLKRDAILVTGANGYIGRHLVAALHAAGEQVFAVASSWSDDAFVDLGGVTPITADIFAPTEELDAALRASKTVVHFAWKDGFVLASRAHPLNLSNHYAFLTRAVELGVTRLSVAGTMHEIGYWEGPVDDATPSTPQSLYGIAKVALRESLLRTFADTPVTVQWLRMFYIVGDDRRSNSIFGKLLQAVDNGSSTFPFTSGKNKFDFIDLDVLIEQLSAVIQHDTAAGVINCVSGEPQTLASRVQQFIDDNSLPITLQYGAFPDRPFDSPGVWGDATAIDAIVAEHTRSSGATSR